MVSVVVVVVVVGYEGRRAHLTDLTGKFGGNFSLSPLSLPR
jgi:hypothetical protein